MTSESSLTFDDDAFVGGLSDPFSTHYRHRRGVLDLVNKLHSYGYVHCVLFTLGVVLTLIQTDCSTSLISLKSPLSAPNLWGKAL
jgi:hypothetical protein